MPTIAWVSARARWVSDAACASSPSESCRPTPERSAGSILSAASPPRIPAPTPSIHARSCHLTRSAIARSSSGSALLHVRDRVVPSTASASITIRNGAAPTDARASTSRLAIARATNDACSRSSSGGENRSTTVRSTGRSRGFGRRSRPEASYHGDRSQQVQWQAADAGNSRTMPPG